MVQLKDTLDKITVADFVDFPKKKDPAMLVIEGEPTFEEIQDCWLGLISQYNKATGSEDTSEYVRYGAKAEYLRKRVDTVQSCVTFIRDTVNNILPYQNIVEIYAQLAPLFDILRYFGYDYPYDMKTILVTMNTIVTSEKQYVLQIPKLDAWIKKYEREHKSEGDGNMWKQVKEVRKFENYNLTPRQMAQVMMMDEFCESIRSIQEHNQLVELQKNEQHGER